MSAKKVHVRAKGEQGKGNELLVQSSKYWSTEALRYHEGSRKFLCAEFLNKDKCLRIQSDYYEGESRSASIYSILHLIIAQRLILYLIIAQKAIL